MICLMLVDNTFLCMQDSITRKVDFMELESVKDQPIINFFRLLKIK